MTDEHQCPEDGDYELVLLRDIGETASRSCESMRHSLTSRINSFVLIVSFVVLGEATIIASTLGLVLSDHVGMPLRLLILVLTLAATALVSCAAYQVYRLFHVNLAILLVPEKQELPYLRPDLLEKKASSLSAEDLRLFEAPLVEQGAEYSNLRLIHRRWVFQKVRALKAQLEKVDTVKLIFSRATALIVCSIACLVAVLVILFSVY